MKKLALGVLVLAAILLLYSLTPFHTYFSREGITALRVWINNQGIWAPLFFVIIYSISIVLLVPASLFIISGGLLFGALWGTCLNLIGTMIGSAICFLLARRLGQKPLEKLLHKHIRFKDLQGMIHEKSFFPIIYLRILPFFPCGPFNYGIGLTRVSFWNYLFAHTIGVIPGIFASTALGAAGSHASLTDPQTWKDHHVWGPFVLVLILIFIPKLLKGSLAIGKNLKA